MYKLSRFRNNIYTVKLHEVLINEEAALDSEKLTTLSFVMEYVSHDLSQLLKYDVELQEDQVSVILYNLLLSLKYLESANVMHRDLKPSNILVTSNCTVKICDFGFARSVTAKVP